MKYFIIAISLMLASPVFAMNATEEHESNVQQKIKQAPEMSSYCVKRLAYLKKKIKKYEDKLKQADKSWYRAKLDYYEKEYKDWTGYCKPKGQD